LGTCGGGCWGVWCGELPRCRCQQGSVVLADENPMNGSARLSRRLSEKPLQERVGLSVGGSLKR